MIGGGKKQTRNGVCKRPHSGEKLGPPAGGAGAECVKEIQHEGCRGREGPRCRTTGQRKLVLS